MKLSKYLETIQSEHYLAPTLLVEWPKLIAMARAYENEMEQLAESANELSRALRELAHMKRQVDKTKADLADVLRMDNDRG